MGLRFMVVPDVNGADKVRINVDTICCYGANFDPKIEAKTMIVVSSNATVYTILEPSEVDEMLAEFGGFGALVWKEKKET